MKVLAEARSLERDALMKDARERIKRKMVLILVEHK
jgi:hypothetical protein